MSRSDFAYLVNALRPPGVSVELLVCDLEDAYEIRAISDDAPPRIGRAYVHAPDLRRAVDKAALVELFANRTDLAIYIARQPYVPFRIGTRSRRRLQTGGPQ